MENLFAMNQKTWVQEILRDICNDRDCELIKQIQIPQQSKEDSWWWVFDDKGEFMVKSCYRRLREETYCPDRNFWKKVWELKLPGKVVNFFWRLCRGILPIAETLREKSVDVHSRCTWCQENAENDMHVLFTCCFAKEVWTKMGIAGALQPLFSDTVMALLQRVFQNSNKELTSLVSMVCWNLWYRRNNWVWNHISISSFGVQSRARNMLTEWTRAQEERVKQLVHQRGISRVWKRPPDEWIKINIDAMCQQKDRRMGVGCVIRDSMDLFVRARSKVIQRYGQPREAEAIGLREALLWTKEWRSYMCIFECDAKGVVDAINTKGGRSYFDMIINNCINILKHFSEVLVVFCPRSANMVALAHLLAQAMYSVSTLRGG